MHAERVTIIVSVVLLAMIVLVSLALIVRRIGLARSDRRDAALAERYRDAVLEFVGTPDAEPGRELRNVRSIPQRAAIATLLARYSRMLRGEARERIRTFLDTEGYVDAAIGELKSLRGWRRGRAVRMLGEFGSVRAVQYLSLSMIQDPSENVRLTAARALGRIDDYKAAAALLMVLPTDRVPRGVIAQSLFNLGPRSFRALVDACDDDAMEIRRVACRLVGLLGEGVGSDARERVLAVLAARAQADPDHEVRVASCRSIGLIGGRASIAAIVRALGDDDVRVRIAACEAAHTMRAVELVSPLRRIVQIDDASGNPEPHLARAAARALAALGTADGDGDAASSPFVVEARDVARICGEAA